MVKRVFDCFTFFNELDVLEIRLGELYDVVDHFVLCEATQTFQGQSKGLVFAENRERFSRYLSKIIHVVVDDMPQTESPWVREDFQRNSIRRGLVDLAPEDIVIISDADEIVSKNTVALLREESGYFLIETAIYQFFLNMLASERWDKVYAFSYRLNDRIPDISRVRVKQDETFEQFADEAHRLTHGGWHFTFLGGSEKVREKLIAYSHVEAPQQLMLQPGEIEVQLKSGFGIGRGMVLQLIEIDETFPKAITGDIEKYRSMGFVKDTITRVRELEKVFMASVLNGRAVDAAYRVLLGRLSALLENGHEMTRGYARPEFTAALHAGENLLVASTVFGGQWNSGAQTVPALPVTHIPYVLLDNTVLEHRRSDGADSEDNNMGWWHIVGLAAEVHYTASCWIWLPLEFEGEYAELFAEGPTPISGEYLNLKLRDRWQRMSTTVLCDENHFVTNLVLRTGCAPRAVFYTTCWQFEVGEKATIYKPT